MDELGFRVYFGEGANRVEWPGFLKWNAPENVVASDTLGRGVSATGERNILTVKRLASEPTPLDVWSWGRTVNGGFVRKDLTIEVFDVAYEQQPIHVYSFKQAWPIKYQGASLKASGSEIILETLVLTHEGLEIR